MNSNILLLTETTFTVLHGFKKYITHYIKTEGHTLKSIQAKAGEAINTINTGCSIQARI
jgi:hypothetical protein